MTSSALDRRSLLALFGAATAAGMLGFPRVAFADAATENRFVLVLLRGALDGLAAVPPYADPRYAARRGGLALPHPGEEGGMLPLDGQFALNAALAPLLPLWSTGEMLIVPATGGGYHTRSHFDAQDMMESGLLTRQGEPNGWLNRAIAELPGARTDRRLGLAVGAAVPIVLRGAIPVGSWEPPDLKPASPVLLAALTQLYAKDALFGPALADGIRAQNLSDEIMGQAGGQAGEMKGARGLGPGAFKVMAQAAGSLLAAPDGPRIAALDMGGWDTHTFQGTTKGRLAANLVGFADGLMQLRTSLGSAWRRTVVVAITEFGRTVSPNGTGGTDHGTASVAFLLGGAVRGGHIVGDWPGLDRLEEDRDLRIATDTRAILKGLLKDHLGVSGMRLDAAVFPGSGDIRPLPGLARV